jgi:hypothetical protein
VRVTPAESHGSQLEIVRQSISVAGLVAQTLVEPHPIGGREIRTWRRRRFRGSGRRGSFFEAALLNIAALPQGQGELRPPCARHRLGFSVAIAMRGLRAREPSSGTPSSPRVM